MQIFALQVDRLGQNRFYAFRFTVCHDWRGFCVSFSILFIVFFLNCILTILYLEDVYVFILEIHTRNRQQEQVEESKQK